MPPTVDDLLADAAADFESGPFALYQAHEDAKSVCRRCGPNGCPPKKGGAACPRAEHVAFNLGCGDDWKPGYINVDVRELTPPPGVTFVRADLADARGLVAQHGRPAKIRAVDCLEHLSIDNAYAAIADWCEALLPDGRLILQVPDLDEISRRAVNGAVRGDRLARLLYGRQDYPENTHASGFTRSQLQPLLWKHGLRGSGAARNREPAGSYPTPRGRLAQRNRRSANGSADRG